MSGIKQKQFLVVKITFLLVILSVLQLLAVTAQSNDDIDIRIENQSRRISRALKEGGLENQQAAKLRATLSSISDRAKLARKKNNGRLSQPELNKFETELNENSTLIRTEKKSSERLPQSAKVLGPNWQTGQDGAQNPDKLRKQMKLEEKRNLRQERQALQQVQKLQQQEYEKEMLKELGQQRPEILGNKQKIEQIRQKTGAD